MLRHLAEFCNLYLGKGGKTMTFRETVLAVLNYQPYEKLPVVSFGYWGETVQKWAAEGHITQEEADQYCTQGDNSSGDRAIMKRLGLTGTPALERPALCFQDLTKRCWRNIPTEAGRCGTAAD